jgi:hypothetical protein
MERSLGLRKDHILLTIISARTKLYIVSVHGRNWSDGHSSGVTPGPISNPAVKPAHVPVAYCIAQAYGKADSLSTTFQSSHFDAIYSTDSIVSINMTLRYHLGNDTDKTGWKCNHR